MSHFRGYRIPFTKSYLLGSRSLQVRLWSYLRTSFFHRGYRNLGRNFTFRNKK